MAIEYKISKEFQLKLRPQLATSDQRAKETVKEMLKWLEDNSALNWKGSSGKDWERTGERYDSEDKFFKANRITLATEKSEDDKNRTKLKCKLHNFVKELLYDTPEESYCHPENGGHEEVKLKFKTEQDIHFNNCKYCATGYMKLPGTDYRFKNVEDFYPFYPNLKQVPGIKSSFKLKRVKHWNEVIFDDIEMSIGNLEMKGALVTRWNVKEKNLDESEFSFKITRTGARWDYNELVELAKVYDLMYSRFADIFLIQDPGIFTFENPASSQEIILSRG